MIPRYSRKQMADIWTDESRFQIWLDVETLAMEAMVQEGLVPESALASVQAKAAFDVDRILEIEAEVKHDVIAFLTCVEENVGEDARFLHLGMTSSDVLDTTLAVQLKRATELILAELSKLIEAVRVQAQRHKKTVCIGRSHGIHAEPTTFGVKLAVWFAELERQRKRIEYALEEISVGAISGPVGTFAHVSPFVEAHVCKGLGLKPEPVSTQVIQRDRHAHLFSAYAQLAGTIEKMSVEVRHLQRTEVREAEEKFTKGQKGSSAMPHKRNPILTENLSGLARVVRANAFAAFENVPLWHERDISHSSVERVIAPDTTVLLDFMLGRMTGVVKNLVVYPENMQKNLDLTGGLFYSGALLLALARSGIPRKDAYYLVQKHGLATWDDLTEGKPASFPDRVMADQEITSRVGKEELEQVFSLDPYLAHVDEIFDRVFGEK